MLLTRIRPSNLIILFALPFIIFLFVSNPDYSRSLSAIIGAVSYTHLVSRMRETVSEVARRIRWPLSRTKRYGSPDHRHREIPVCPETGFKPRSRIKACHAVRPNTHHGTKPAIAAAVMAATMGFVHRLILAVTAVIHGHPNSMCH